MALRPRIPAADISAAGDRGPAGGSVLAYSSG